MKGRLNNTKSNCVRRYAHHLIIVLLMSALVAANRSGITLANDGALDPLFGSGGKVTTVFPTTSDGATAAAVAIQADGRVVAVGSENLDTIPGNFALARYEADGDLDNTFGTGGRVTTDFSGSSDFAHAVAIQPNGRIVVAGVTALNSGNSDFALARYKTDGTLDNNFGQGGRRTLDFLGQNDFASAVAVQPDGRIVVAGYTFNGAQLDFALARYNPDGNLDGTFGTVGRVTTDFSGNHDRINAIAIQPDGRIVAAGATLNATEGNFALARYNSDGTLDNSFGAGGKLTTDFFGGNDQGNAVALQSDGRIIMAGRIVVSLTDDNFGLVRYLPDGTPDSNFGLSGKVSTDFFGSRDYAYAVSIQADGRIVAAGAGAVNGGQQLNFALARYETNGVLDNGFGTGGRITTDFFGHNDEANGMAIQPDGQIVLAGSAATGEAQLVFALARYLGDSPEVSYNVCVQDESNGNLLKFNSTTGEYLFSGCGYGVESGGLGSLTVKGCTVTLQHNTSDRRVLVKVDTCTKKSTASVQFISQGKTYTVVDKNITNNTCVCLNAQP